MDFMDVLPTDVSAMLEHFRVSQKPRQMRRCAAQHARHSEFDCHRPARPGDPVTTGLLWRKVRAATTAQGLLDCPVEPGNDSAGGARLDSGFALTRAPE
jgi:hypothetical protein